MAAKNLFNANNTSSVCNCRCSAVTPTTSTTRITTQRKLRSPTLTSPKKVRTAEELEENTRNSLRRKMEPVGAMKMIDTFQRLGISYHYEEEINIWLEKIQEWDAGNDLNATALRFRLLRQNAMPITSDVFQKFIGKERDGNFRKSSVQDREGLLNLYEASYLGGNGDDILLDAMKFSKSQLSFSSAGTKLHLSRRIGRALELPMHLRMERLESRLYIDEYCLQPNHSVLLLEHARSDYNLVQSLYQDELAEMERWWKQLGIIDQLSFARDRPVECFLWTVGIFPECKYSGARIDLAKTIAILLVIDDIFDTYGKMDELSLFKNAVQRWNLDEIEQLPKYMKICYMALYNTTNEIAFKILKEQGRNILVFLKKAWIDTIEAFMIEATWFSNGHTPCLDDYLENGVTTSGAYMALVHAFFLMGNEVTTTNMKLMTKPYPKIFSNSGRILRLWDDLGTAKEEQDRGDNASSIKLLMKEKNVGCEDEAREHTMQLILNLWRDLNTELIPQGSNSTSLPLSIIKACFHMSRTSQVIYQHQEDSYFSNVDKFVDFLLYKPINYKN